MKSHVRENIQKAGVEYHIHRYNETDEGSQVRLSDFAQNLVKSEVPELDFTNWFVYNNPAYEDKKWSADIGLRGRDDHLLTIYGRTLSDVVKNAKKLIIDGEEID